MGARKAEAIRIGNVQQAILFIRGQKVLLDRDLAVLYGVTTVNLNKAVRRNFNRFPKDFMFQLTKEEVERSRFQIGSLNRGQNVKYLPFVFTEQGVAMLSSVLKGDPAAKVNIAIMRAFVRLREALTLHKELAHKLTELEGKIEAHDENIQTLFDAIRKLMAPPEVPRKEMGFHVLREEGGRYRVGKRTR